MTLWGIRLKAAAVGFIAGLMVAGTAWLCVQCGTP